MTSPAVHVECNSCLDLRASRERLERELARVIFERDHYAARVKELQARGTELVEENRTLRASEGAWAGVTRPTPDAIMPGWTCVVCQTFNGEAKLPRGVCRACGALRHGLTFAGGVLEGEVPQ